MTMAGGPQEGELKVLITKPRTTPFAKVAVLTVAVGASVVFSASRSAQPQLRASADSSMHDHSYSSIVELFDDATQGVASLNVEFALCDTGFCTTNGDNLTASCGCLSMRPTEKLGGLVLGWAAAVLGDSAVYREAIASTDGDRAVARMLETAITDRTLFDGYFDEAPTRVSLFAPDNEYFSNPPTAQCTNVNSAQCMGAPCFDRVYDGIWNITCICPYAQAASASTAQTHEGICDDASASGTGCALVGKTMDNASSYTAPAFKSMLTAVKQAHVTIHGAECPTYITTDDEEGTRASLA